MSGRARLLRTAILAGLTMALAASFVALGWWQLERRDWKIGLIDRVESRVTADPVAAPGRDDWADLTRAGAEYRRVEAEGTFGEGVALVQAVTDAGGGYWVMSPFTTDGGMTMLVNRGFVAARDAEIPRPEGVRHIVGLLRMSEPDGGFLRDNDPAGGWWYSRDVEALARDMDLGPVAPYFVDAEAGANGGGPPVGGLTVVSFRNTHLVYALTWFTLAAMCVVATGAVLRAGLARPRPAPGAG